MPCPGSDAMWDLEGAVSSFPLPTGSDIVKRPESLQLRVRRHMAK